MQRCAFTSYKSFSGRDGECRAVCRENVCRSQTRIRTRRPIQIRLGSIPGPNPVSVRPGIKFVAVLRCFFFHFKKTNISGFVGNQLPEFFYIFVNAVGFLIHTAGSVAPAANRVRVPRVYIMVTVRGYMRLIDRDPTGVYRTRARV